MDKVDRSDNHNFSRCFWEWARQILQGSVLDISYNYYSQTFPITALGQLSQITLIRKLNPTLYSIIGLDNTATRLQSLEKKVAKMDARLSEEVEKLNNRIKNLDGKVEEIKPRFANQDGARIGWRKWFSFYLPTW